MCLNHEDTRFLFGFCIHSRCNGSHKTVTNCVSTCDGKQRKQPLILKSAVLHFWATIRTIMFKYHQSPVIPLPHMNHKGEVSLQQWYLRTTLYSGVISISSVNSGQGNRSCQNCLWETANVWFSWNHPLPITNTLVYNWHFRSPILCDSRVHLHLV